ncbi:hypothetical protein [Paenibacillus xylaniclasticus]|uniref:hypothetical protein n=1 Tax=Paenibacillus xylaniclasticus TaxID=588083 RepID=UPI000FD7EEB1|nr:MULTISPECIES: hypothetical protein [Paenibacillus]GFN30743.1 hypothetical protein PCURB6_10030 [Paenibacillus curdlanolyticus]
MEEEINRLKRIILQLLLTSENRTTDLLEMIASDSMRAVVVKQEHSGQTYELRESYLIAERNWTIVSQNLVILYPERIPESIYRRITMNGEGIGHVLRESEVPNRRKLLAYGWRDTNEVVDLFHKPYRLKFQANPQTPFKEYTISFSDQRTAIHILEYFNPEIIMLPTHFDPTVCYESRAD